jgi:predicted amidophosphoribosyltransferase
MARQMPCPDCGAAVRPEVDQLCPNCGYPLMFLRQTQPQDEARAVPRSPNEPVTGIYHTRTYTSDQSPPVHTGPGVQCPGCGYPNEQARIRCERCGRELRAARPQAVRLGPPPATPPDRRWLVVLLIVLGVLAVLSIAGAVVAYLFF